MPNSVSNLYVYYQNVRSIKSKVNEIYVNLTDAEFDLIAITESWLDSSVADSEFAPVNYQVFRSDRDFIRSGRQTGGGVILAINGKHKVKNLDLSMFKMFPLIDITGCKLIYPQNNIYVFVVYIPPDISITDFDSFIDCFGNFALEFQNILLFGDFNVAAFLNNTNSKSNLLHRLMSLLNLSQYNSVYNSDGNLLDLVFSSFKKCVVTHDPCPLVKEDVYHPALNINFLVKQTSYASFPVCRTEKLYNFRKSNFPSLYQDILDIDWKFLYELTDVEEACEHFYKRLYVTFDKNVPLFKCSKYKYPSWYSKELRDMLKNKFKLFKRWKFEGSNQAYNEFSLIRCSVKKLIRRDFNAHINKTQDSLLKDSKYFWKFTKEKQGRSSVPNEVHLDDKTCSDPSEIVNTFAHYFHSTFNSSTKNLTPKITNSNSSSKCRG